MDVSDHRYLIAVSSTWKTHDSTHTEIRRQKYRVFNKVLSNISDKLKRSKVWYILIKTKMDVHKGPKITNSHSFNHIKNEDVTGISNTIPVNEQKQ